MKHFLKNRSACLAAAGIAAVAAALVLGLILGTTRISPADIFKALFSGATTPEGQIVRYVRIPRTLAGLLSGAALALAGALIQGTLSNRLASASIIGVNSGAALAITVAAAFGITGGWRVSLFAFVGALFAVAVVAVGSSFVGASRGTVILIGVALNATFAAAADAIIAFFPDISVMSADFRVGDLSAANYKTLIPAGIMILIGAVAALLSSGYLDVLTLGEDTARGLGINTNLARAALLMLAAMLAGAAVSIAGLLSFVGLLVPHAVRRLMGSSGSILLPTLLFGGAFVSICDTLSRTVTAPYELPVGILMAAIGAPLFIVILLRKGGAGYDQA